MKNAIEASVAIPLRAEARPGARSRLGDLPILLASVAIQLSLALMFGHAYDMRIFMAAGHQVAHGENPYLPQDLSAVFENSSFENITTVGYPPPWPLLLGAICRLAYHSPADFLLYNAAIKLPLILANLLLAYAVAVYLRRLGAGGATARAGWLFLLFNPFLLYASAAWGQFDSIVALLSMASLWMLDGRQTRRAALLLALAISFKPTALPLLLIPLYHGPTIQAGRRLRFYATFALGALAFCVAPFFLLGWDSTPILHGWNAHFTVGGGMTPLAALELFQDSYEVQGSWWMVGMLWIPALGAAAISLRGGIGDFRDLLRRSTALIMVFFLTRAWLSEPNIILVLPLALVLVHTGDIERRWLHALWVLPLLFGVVNVSLAQLFFPSMPHVMDAFLQRMWAIDTARFIAKVVIVAPWQILGWSIVVRCLRPAAPTASA